VKTLKRSRRIGRGGALYRRGGKGRIEEKNGKFFRSGKFEKRIVKQLPLRKGG